MRKLILYILGAILSAVVFANQKAELIPQVSKSTYDVPNVGQVVVIAKTNINPTEKLHVSIGGVKVKIPEEVINGYEAIDTSSVRCTTNFIEGEFYLFVRMGNFEPEVGIVMSVIRIDVVDRSVVDFVVIKED